MPPRFAIPKKFREKSKDEASNRVMGGFGVTLPSQEYEGKVFAQGLARLRLRPTSHDSAALHTRLWFICKHLAPSSNLGGGTRRNPWFRRLIEWRRLVDVVENPREIRETIGYPVLTDVHREA
ncbi:MAG: hypothetical protein WBG92_10490 [Thiohalocapsa sp.]